MSKRFLIANLLIPQRPAGSSAAAPCARIRIRVPELQQASRDLAVPSAPVRLQVDRNQLAHIHTVLAV